MYRSPCAAGGRILRLESSRVTHRLRAASEIRESGQKYLLARVCVDGRFAAYRRTSIDICFDVDLSSSLIWVLFQGVLGFNNSPLVLTAAYLASIAKSRQMGGACIFSISKLHTVRS